MLLLASFAIVCTLLVVLSDQSQILQPGEHARIALLFGLAMALAMIGLAVMLRPRVRNRSALPRDAVDVAELD